MHAIRQYEFGPAENLLYEEVPDPVPGEGQVRIAVEAIGVHLVDTSIRAGTFGGAFPLPELPMTPGREVAGVVESVGAGVEERWIGRRVVAHVGLASGGYAELVLAPASSLHELPDDLSAETAVAMIGTGRTAVAILDLASLTAGDVVLVTSAAGGLGTLFVQTAQHVGALAVGVAGGPEKLAQVQANGAKVAVDYNEPDWPEQVRAALGGREVTVVLDGVGGPIGQAALDLLGAGGRLVMFGYSSGEPTQLTTKDLLAKSLTVSWALGSRPFQGGLRPLETRALQEAVGGTWLPTVQTFPLADAARAHAELEARRTSGKVVLIP
jgi:NADPH:quinone reductase